MAAYPLPLGLLGHGLPACWLCLLYKELVITRIVGIDQKLRQRLRVLRHDLLQELGILLRFFDFFWSGIW